MPTVHLFDYVAGNERSLVNAIRKCGYDIAWIKSPDEIPQAEKLIVPGVGHFGHCLTQMSAGHYTEPIKKHIKSGKPYLGICVGLQALFASSSEDPEVPGFSLLQGSLTRFNDADKSVPHIGWNSAHPQAVETFYGLNRESKYYYVHSYAVPYQKGQLEEEGWTVATGKYGNEEFIGAIGRGNVLATQFHPEKSGAAGLKLLKAWLDGDGDTWSGHPKALNPTTQVQSGLTRRIIACLDVRTNDAGDIVVTKGDQYDVKERDGVTTGGAVRNLGKPVEVAQRYYEQGADEITFLNITAFRNCPLKDLPMLEILRKTSETVFVPLTIGGGIKDTTDVDGKTMSALDVARLYFKAGADKVSIGGDAVLAAEEYYERGCKLSGLTGIETISKAYGNQAVVVSVDPKKVFVDSPEATHHHTIETPYPDNETGQRYVWYQCTMKGGREKRDLDVIQLVKAVEAMGCGEILLNSIDKDGTNSGFDLELINDVKAAVKIPVIASSGAGNPDHFEEVFTFTGTDAALGAGMFHRREYTVKQVKDYLADAGLVIRPVDADYIANEKPEHVVDVEIS